MQRKSYLFVKLCLLFSIGLRCAAQVEPRNPFSLTLEASRTRVKLGNPIDFTIQITNTTDKPINMLLGPGDRMSQKYFRVVAVDSNGKPVVETPRGEIAHGKPDGHIAHGSDSAWLGTIAPGQHFMQHLSVDKLYVFDRLGIYRVYVTRDTDEEPVSHVNSNIIEIEITN